MNKILFALFIFFSTASFVYAGTWSTSTNHPSIPPPVQACGDSPLYPTVQMGVGTSCSPDGATYTWGPTSQCDLGGGEFSIYQNSNGVQRQTCNPSANNPPTANAGVDRSISLPTTSVVISGAQASDADSGVASTIWSYVNGPGPTPTITNSSTLTPTFNGMSTAGVYQFRLRVTDNGSPALFTDDTMTVTVNVANPQCNDNSDNDGDGRTDEDDWGCHSDNNAVNAASYVSTDNDESNPYCNVPGWNDPGILAYDGDISGPGAGNWCNGTSFGSCPSNLGGGITSISAKGSAGACCYVDAGNPYLGWIRQCTGSAPTPIAAVCGSSNGTAISSEPVGGSAACQTGTYSNSPADTSTNWNWTCTGINGGANASCSATKTPPSSAPSCTYGIQATQTRSSNAQALSYNQYNMGWASPTCNTSWDAPFMNDSATFARNNGVPESPDVDALESSMTSWFPQPGMPEEYDTTTSNTTRLTWRLEQWQGSQADLIPCLGQITVNVCNSPPNYTLTTAVSPGGSGTVTATGINCGADCSETYVAGTNLTVTATINPGYNFVNWSCSSSVCNGLSTTQFSIPGIGANLNATANFTATNAVPTVTLPTVASITTTGATLGATVSSLGVPASISARGTCWGTTPAPTTNCTAQGGLTTGVFTHARTGMPTGTLIYYRGYAINTTGTGYSVDATFNTSSQPDLTAGAPSPAVATQNVALTFTSTISNAVGAGTGVGFNNFFQVNNGSNGGGATTVDLAPTAMAALASGGNGVATSPSYTFPLVQTYSVRACADKTNSASAGVITESNEANNCGAWTNVAVSAGNAVPTVTTPTATSITTTGATLGANVTSLGVPASISARGTCWGTTPAPTTNCTAQGGLTTGIFTHARTGMPTGTTIYYRGYAINTTGTGYSVDATFNTSSLPDLIAGTPSPTTATVGIALTFTTTISNIGAASTVSSFNNLFQVATAAGGGGTVSTISVNSRAFLDAGTNGPVTSNAYTFPSSGTYSVRTCADNNGSTGTITESGEGANCGAWTNVAVSAGNAVPTVTTPTATSITTTGATLGANVTSLGVPASISARGTCWGTTPAPTTNCTAQGGLTTGIFTHARTGMPTGTTIYYRGYAINTTGTGYSVDSSFTTGSLPDLTAGAPSPAVATQNVALTFTSTISNAVGAGTGVGFNNFFQVNNGSNGGGATTVDLAPTAMAALASGGNGVATSPSYTFPLVQTYSVRACADKSNRNSIDPVLVTESNEGNNCGAWTNVAVGASFNYNLTNSGTTNVPKTSGNAFGTNVITKNVTSGTDPGVTLSLSGHPSGVGYSASPWSCTPTCTSTITFTVPPSTPIDTYPILVTGSPLNRTTNFDLVITGNPMTVTCSGNPPTVLLGENVTWSAVPNGGTAPYTYLWSLDVPSPAPTVDSFVTKYSTIGIKFAQVEVTDADGLTEDCTPSAAVVQVNFDPSFEEF